MIKLEKIVSNHGLYFYQYLTLSGKLLAVVERASAGHAINTHFFIKGILSPLNIYLTHLCINHTYIILNGRCTIRNQVQVSWRYTGPSGKKTIFYLFFKPLMILFNQ